MASTPLPTHLHVQRTTDSLSPEEAVVGMGEKWGRGMRTPSEHRLPGKGVSLSSWGENKNLKKLVSRKPP